MTTGCYSSFTSFQSACGRQARLVLYPLNPDRLLFFPRGPSKLIPLAKRNALFRPKLMKGKNMKYLNDKLILRSPADLRPVHQLKLNTIFRLILIVLLGSAGLSARADLQKGQTAYDRGDYATALREWKPLAEQGNAEAQLYLGWMYTKQPSAIS